MALPEDRYLSDFYVSDNPTWDAEDSPWKASLVAALLRDVGIAPSSICDVGCGAGGVLRALREYYGAASLTGFDVAPAASKFWSDHRSADIQFILSDFLTVDSPPYDVILVLDVIEHLADPFRFLNGLRGRARFCVLHIPLDLCAISVLRESPLLAVRRKVGHIHYFTKELALSLISEAGFRVVEWRYTGAGLRGSRCSNARMRTLVASVPRRAGRVIGKDLAVRAMGGETLLVLAELPAADPESLSTISTDVVHRTSVAPSHDL